MSVSDLRELPDGRIVFAEAGFKGGLAIADFQSQDVHQVGRFGDGPGEYRGVNGLFALHQDSTLIVDTRSRRILVMVGEKITKGYPPDWPGLGEFAQSIQVLGGDQDGRILLKKSMGDPGPGHRAPFTLLLYTVATGRPDSIGTISLRGGASESDAYIEPSEWAVLTWDGWVAVVRTNPYRVDWRAPNGEWHLGKPIPVEKVPVTDREKAAYYEWRAKRYYRGEKTHWPKYVPPLDMAQGKGGNPIATFDGKLLILRNNTADLPGMRYDVVNRSGALDGFIFLPDNEWILGFGKRSVYVAVKDSDDVVRIRRHPWP